jgi:hypothetical protein
MIRRLIAWLRAAAYALTLRRWRRWHHKKFCEQLREGDYL